MTSVTIVESRNYVDVKRDRNKKTPAVAKKPDKTPRFEFYLYNDAGRIIKQYLTIHEIQQILLQQSQSLGNICTFIERYHFVCPYKHAKIHMKS